MPEVGGFSCGDGKFGPPELPVGLLGANGVNVQPSGNTKPSGSPGSPCLRAVPLEKKACGVIGAKPVGICNGVIIGSSRPPIVEEIDVC